ncbi:hypothetical protein RRG08_056351 [Elysia crispata]|uniref:Uncharacterized protein n=1 Tax=Elysia crispata TaxID=231223 RepID=A0AAE0YQA5_9GAST|nr:hypothetical protein RRG08_056351 [Elysia crispata]
MAEINEVIRRYVPEKSTIGDRKKCLDGGTLSAVRKKHKMHRRWIETRDGHHCQEYAKARNKAARECRKAKIRLEKTVAEQAKRNPKSFWSYVKAKTSTRSGIGDLKRDDGTIASTDKEKAQVFNDFFQSVFTEEPDGELPKAPQFPFNSPLTNIDFKTEDIRKLLTKLKSGKAAGPDDIPTILLTETAEALLYPLVSSSGNHWMKVVSQLGKPASDQTYFMADKNSTTGKHPLKTSKAEKDLGVVVNRDETGHGKWTSPTDMSESHQMRPGDKTGHGKWTSPTDMSESHQMRPGDKTGHGKWTSPTDMSESHQMRPGDKTGHGKWTSPTDMSESHQMRPGDKTGHGKWTSPTDMSESHQMRPGDKTGHGKWTSPTDMSESHQMRPGDKTGHGKWTSPTDMSESHQMRPGDETGQTTQGPRRPII